MNLPKYIFNNPLPKRTLLKGEHSKQKYIKKFGDDRSTHYPLCIKKNPTLHSLLGVHDIKLAPPDDTTFDIEKGIIIGNIRMGFGHYRISIAMASAAHALGYTPYWLDLNSYTETTGGKIIQAQNKLYSLGSRLSSKSFLFNHLIWEPLNYEGFRQLSYNYVDQRNAELMTPIFRDIPRSLPIIATHVWPAQAAIHAGFTHVVNAIPDNWPMALHLAEGSLHTVQTYSSYIGYRTLNGMSKKKILNPMPDDSLCYTGHYVDHELVSHIEEDCETRMNRITHVKPLRILLTIGGAGAQKSIFEAIIKHLLPSIIKKQVILYINVGDYRNVWEELLSAIPNLKHYTTCHFDDFNESSCFIDSLLKHDTAFIHTFYHQDIFQAVYITNLLMRVTDLLITKPSELAFYPIPKLFIKHVGGHEKWGAIHSAEIGDGTIECEDIPHTLQMLDLFLTSPNLMLQMCRSILHNHSIHLYDGAYEAVKLAVKNK